MYIKTPASTPFLLLLCSALPIHLLSCANPNLQKACVFLGITHNELSKKNIQKAYHKKVKLFHPDKHKQPKDKPQATEKFKKLQSHYHFLLQYVEKLKKRINLTPTLISEQFLKIHNACLIFGLKTKNVTGKEIKKEHKELHNNLVLQLKKETDKHTQASIHLQLLMLDYAKRILLNHPEERVVALNFIIAGKKIPVKTNLSIDSQLVSYVLFKETNKNKEPSLEIMRAYAWHNLALSIENQQMKKFHNRLTANPFLFCRNIAAEKNIYLRDDKKRAMCALKAAHLTLDDLVNLVCNNTTVLAIAQQETKFGNIGHYTKKNANKMYLTLKKYGSTT